MASGSTGERLNARGLAGLHDLATHLHARVDVSPGPADHAFDFLADLTIDGVTRRFAVTIKSRLDEAAAASLRARPLDLAGSVPLIISERVSRAAADALTTAGFSWLDLHGRTHLRAPGLLVDSALPIVSDPLTRPGRGEQPIRGRAGISVAYWMCLHRGDAISPTRHAPGLGISPASISVVATQLADAGLAAGRIGVFPELFWELASIWRPERVWLAQAPVAADHLDAEGRTQWLLGGDPAASAHGAPVITAGLERPTLYAKGPLELSVATRLYGSAKPGLGAATLAVAPASAVMESDLGEVVDGWSLVPRLAATLDLASDPARGAEIVRNWIPEPTDAWA